MATYGAMQTRIADEIARSDLTSQIQYAILDAIKAHEGTSFWFNELYRSTATVSTGEYFIALPSNVLKIDKIILQVNSSVEDYLIARDARFILEAQTPLYTSQPKEYAIYGGKILFDAQSDAVYPIYINGLQTFTAPSVDASTSPWFVEAEELIRNRAKANLYTDVIMDAENAAKCERREAMTLQYLMSKSNIRGSGKVRPTQF